MCDDIASISLCGVDSIKTNAIINSKIGTSKCVKIHIGKNYENCYDLKVLEPVMKVYLSDVVCNSGKNAQNIAYKLA